MSPASARVVLYVVNDLVYFRAHRQALADAVAAMGFDVVVIAGNCTQSDERASDPYTLIAFDIERQAFAPLADFKLARFVRNWVRLNRPDIVHMITIKPALFATLGLVLPTRLIRFPLIWTLPGLGKVYEPGTALLHRMRRRLTSAGLALAAGRSGALITVENAFDRTRLIGQDIADPEQIKVIDGTGLDLHHFSAPAVSGKADKDDRLIFLLATRLLKAKGIGAYIDAARMVKREGVSARFLLAGITDAINPDAFDEGVIEKAAREGVIEWLGPVDQDAMPDLLRRTDVFCLPTQLQEGLPRSLMEAAACGCALVAPDQIPVRRFLIDSETGILIERADAHQLVTAFRTLIDQPQKTRQMGAEAARHIRTLPVGDDDVLQQFLSLYGLEDAAA